MRPWSDEGPVCGHHERLVDALALHRPYKVVFKSLWRLHRYLIGIMVTAPCSFTILRSFVAVIPEFRLKYSVCANGCVFSGVNQWFVAIVYRHCGLMRAFSRFVSSIRSLRSLQTFRSSVPSVSDACYSDSSCFLLDSIVLRPLVASSVSLVTFRSYAYRFITIWSWTRKAALVLRHVGRWWPNCIASYVKR